MSAGKIILLIFGILGLLVSIGLLVGGGTLLWADNALKDGEGFYATETIQIEKDSYAIITGPADIDIETGWDRGLGWDLGELVTFKVKGSNNDLSKQIFIGIAKESDVNSYFSGVEYDEVINLNIHPYVVDYENRSGSVVPGAPTSQTFWTESVYGAGNQTLELELESGSYSLVIMNEDGSAGIDVDVILGAKVPLLLGIGIGLLVGGFTALCISILLLYLAARKPSVVIPETSKTSTPAKDKEEIKVSDTQTHFKPGVTSSYENGWRQLWKYFLPLFLILIISGLISLPTAVNEIDNNLIVPVLGFFAVLYGIFIEGPVAFGVSYASLKAARGDRLTVVDMFAAFRNYLNAVLASLLTGMIIAFGLILLIIPGIIFACKLAFTPYLVVDRKMEVIEAMKTSWRMTDGHAMEVFGIALLAIPVCVAGFLLFGVGIILSIMWINLAFASLYHSVGTYSEMQDQQKDSKY
ncbi:YciC family protein, partial [Chloroflexota bacterium]